MQIFFYGVFAGALLSMLAFALLDFFNANRKAECDKGECGACDSEEKPKPAAKPAIKAASKPAAKSVAKKAAKPAAKAAPKKAPTKKPAKKK